MFRHLSKREKTNIIYIVIITVIALILLASYIFGNSRKQNSKGQSEDTAVRYNVMHYIDAGQGDCTLIETYDGKFALIDTSTQDSAVKIVDYLTDKGVTELEFVLFTHPHEDHIGGGNEVLENFTVKTVYMNDRTESTSAYERLLRAIKTSKNDKGTKVLKPESGDTFRLSDIVFTVISDGDGYETINDSSICVRADAGESSFLFTGDAEAIVEYAILDSGVNIDCDIFKCAHHGSSTSNTEEFLNEISPEICIVSCGLNNDYGHPHREVVGYLADNNIKMYRTDLDGDIMIAFNEFSFSVI